MRVIALNPALPIFSRILVSGNGLNYKNIVEFIIIMIIVFMAPGICYRLTGDEYKSSTLCLMPAAMWGIIAYFSYSITPCNDEIIIMLFAAFLHTVVSILMYLRFLYRNVWNPILDDYDDDGLEFEEYDY